MTAARQVEIRKTCTVCGNRFQAVQIGTKQVSGVCSQACREERSRKRGRAHAAGLRRAEHISQFDTDEDASLRLNPVFDHPLANIFPLVEASALLDLVADVREHGVRDKIVIYEGKILDGRNRYRAGILAKLKTVVAGPKELGFGGQLAPPFRLFRPEVDGDPLAFVVSLNLHRRHLTESQRAMVAAKIARLPRGRPSGDNPPDGGLSAETAAAQLNVGARSVERAKRVLRDGAEELQAAVDKRKLTVNTAVALASLPKAEQIEVLASADPLAVKTIAKQVRAAQQKLKRTVRLAHMDMVAERGKASAPATLGRVYPVIYADPPWKFGVRSEETGRDRGAENHYPTMPTDDICTLMAGLIGGDNPAVLFLWATNPMLPDGLRVMDACGFAYVHHWIWDKEVAGTGYWGRDRHELLLIGRRGDIAAPLPGTQPETVHRERKGPHSAKPAWFAETIERLYPGIARLEMFCRTPRAGWDVWGFESEGASA